MATSRRLRRLHGHVSALRIDGTVRPAAEESSRSRAVRVTDGLLGGHVHPAICVAPASGDVVVVYNRGPGDASELLMCRSADRGLSWTAPTVLPSSVDRCPGGVYPGALTVLGSGEILLHWYRYGPTAELRWQYGPEFCVSTDDGHTFGPPQLIDTPERQDGRTQPEGRFPFLELDDETYDRTVAYNRRTGDLAPWGDGRNHGMVPLVRSSTGALISGAPQMEAPAPVGRPDPSSAMANGLRSTDAGLTWQPLHQLGHFGVCGYDLTVLSNGWIAHTAVIYGVGVDGEYAYELWLSRDDGLSFDRDHCAVVYNPGRGWPRTVQLDDDTLGTLFYDLTESPQQVGGPSLWFQQTKIQDLLPPGASVW